MNKDIVARLRGFDAGCGCPCCQFAKPHMTEAADEIEKLRAQLAQDDMDISNLSRAGLEYRARIEKLEAEIARLEQEPTGWTVT